MSILLSCEPYFPSRLLYTFSTTNNRQRLGISLDLTSGEYIVQKVVRMFWPPNTKGFAVNYNPVPEEFKAYYGSRLCKIIHPSNRQLARWHAHLGLLLVFSYDLFHRPSSLHRHLWHLKNRQHLYYQLSSHFSLEAITWRKSQETSLVWNKKTIRWLPSRRYSCNYILYSSKVPSVISLSVSSSCSEEHTGVLNFHWVNTLFKL